MSHLWGLYPGICLTTEEKARKNLSQGSRRVPVGTMKVHKHTIIIHSFIYCVYFVKIAELLVGIVWRCRLTWEFKLLWKLLWRFFMVCDAVHFGANVLLIRGTDRLNLQYSVYSADDAISFLWTAGTLVPDDTTLLPGIFQYSILKVIIATVLLKSKCNLKPVQKFVKQKLAIWC